MSFIFFLGITSLVKVLSVSVKVNKGAVVNSRQVLLILATANDAKGRQAIMGTILVGASLFIADNVEWLICSAIRSVLVW